MEDDNDDWLRVTYRPRGGEAISQMAFSPEIVREMWPRPPTLSDYVDGALTLLSIKFHQQGRDPDGCRVMCIRGGIEGACVDRWLDPIVIEQAHQLSLTI